MNSSDPISVGESMKLVQQRLGAAQPDRFATLVAEWGSLVGQRLAEHCSPESLVSGNLSVSVTSPGVAEQVKWATSDLIAAANAILGEDLVTRVSIINSRG